MSADNQAAPQPQKITVSIQQILQDLKDGIDRNGIAKKYGLKKSQVTQIFKHEKLKNKKVRRPVEDSYVLVDEEEQTSEVINAAIPADQPVQETVAATEEQPKTDPDPTAEAKPEPKARKNW